MRQLQDEVQRLINEYDLVAKAEFRLLDVMSELGEVCKELLKSSDYGNTEVGGDTTKLAEELGDLLFSIITVANSFDIDLEIQLQSVLKKYKNRMKTKGKIGSGE